MRAPRAQAANPFQKDFSRGSQKALTHDGAGSRAAPAISTASSPTPRAIRSLMGSRMAVGS